MMFNLQSAIFRTAATTDLGGENRQTSHIPLTGHAGTREAHLLDKFGIQRACVKSDVNAKRNTANTNPT